MNGLFMVDANGFPKLNPTDKQTIRPCPAVVATASMSSIVLPLSFIALLTVTSISSM